MEQTQSEQRIEKGSPAEPAKSAPEAAEQRRLSAGERAKRRADAEAEQRSTGEGLSAGEGAKQTADAEAEQRSTGEGLSAGGGAKRRADAEAEQRSTGEGLSAGEGAKQTADERKQRSAGEGLSAGGGAKGLSAGQVVGEPLPYYHKRAFAHNYRAPFIYHIILKKREGVPRFGEVRGDARIAPGQPGCAYMEESELGRVIAKAILRLPKLFPILQIYQFMVMPDHVHILLRVKEWSEKHLDFYIESLVSAVGNNYSAITGTRTAGTTLFQPGYCDKPLLLKRSLDGLFRYIRENPHRLAMRHRFPQFFRRIRSLRIDENEFEAYGNLFLFRNPDKEAVKISRSYSAEEKARKKSGWLNSAANGTVLVSPFISKEEKAVRKEAEALGGKIILITHEAFPGHYKPAAHDFNLCTGGRLLIISLGLPPGTTLSRSLCLRMNKLAQTIAEV